MSRARKRLIVQRASAVPEIPQPEWSHPMAGALCMLAVGQWARDFETHVQLAAAAYDQCCNGFSNVEVTEAARKELVNIIKNCGKGRR
jgi:hypothetical protein